MAKYVFLVMTNPASSEQPGFVRHTAGIAMTAMPAVCVQRVYAALQTPCLKPR